MADVYKGYDNTVNYLYSLQKHGIKLGLTNIIRLMGLLGEPHKSSHSIHVAGTNGKGSTATAISSILIENGFKVGLYTSPHLVSFTERIRINNERITEADVIALASEIRGTISRTDLNPTFFEFVTAMAFNYFALNKVDWAVVETGMGGRLDATNVIQPEVAIITNIGYDHCEFLGDSISDITFEKAGIIKPHVPVITASQIPEVITQLSDIARSRNTGIHIFNKDFRGSLHKMDEKKIIMDYCGYENYGNLTVPLSGEYQLNNICTAVRACEILRQEKIHISDNSIRTGLQNVKIEGRLERVSQSPHIIIDSAHNPEAARSLAVSVKKLFPDKKIILIVGIMHDKDIGGILNPLIRIAGAVILTKANYERAAAPAKLGEILATTQGSIIKCNNISLFSTKTVKEALDLSKSLCGQDDIILVTGSFYTTGEVKEVLGFDSVLSGLREFN